MGVPQALPWVHPWIMAMFELIAHSSSGWAIKKPAIILLQLLCTEGKHKRVCVCVWLGQVGGCIHAGSTLRAKVTQHNQINHRNNTMFVIHISSGQVARTATHAMRADIPTHLQHMLTFVVRSVNKLYPETILFHARPAITVVTTRK